MLTLGHAPAEDTLAALPQWWYACLYTGGAAAADDVVAGVLPPLMADLRLSGTRRWFFIRYFDEVGPHLRLRVFGPGRALDRLVRGQEDIKAHLALIAERGQRAGVELVPGPTLPGQLRTEHGLSPAVYEPEVDKYGGLAGVELAEAFFEFSSELAVWTVSHHSKGGSRDALAALLLADASHALREGPHSRDWPQRRGMSWSRYWQIHAEWWTGRAVGEEARYLALRERAERQGTAAMTRMVKVALDPDVAAWRRRWWRVVDLYLADAHRFEVPRSPQHLTFHHNHMLMNRLGYLPREEALLGMLAGQWLAGLNEAGAQTTTAAPHPTTGQDDEEHSNDEH